MTVMGAAILAPLAIGVKTATEFGSAMAGVASLGVQNMGALEKAVRTVAVAYGQDLIGATKATYQMISAGISEMDAPLILAEAAKAATAGQTDLTTAIELGTAMTAAFGGAVKDMSKVFDSAFIAVKLGVTTFEELSASAGKTAPSFAAAGLSLDEMYASVAALTKGGFETSVAFTSMNAVVAAFTRQGESGRLKALGLHGALKWLQDEVKGDQTAMLKFLGSTEAMSATLSLTGAVAGDFTDIMGAMGDKAGATKTAFDIIAASDPAFAWRQLKATMQDLAITVGQAVLPALGKIVAWIGPIVTKIAEWMKAHKGLTTTILLVVGAIGGLMITLGPVLMMLPGLIALVGSLGAIFGAIVSPIGIAVAAIIAAVVAIGIVIYKHWDTIKPIFQKGVAFVLNVVSVAWAELKRIWTIVLDAITPIVVAWWELEKAIWTAAMAVILPAVELFWKAIWAAWRNTIGAIIAIVTMWWTWQVKIWTWGTQTIIPIMAKWWQWHVDLWAWGTQTIIPMIKTWWQWHVDIWTWATETLTPIATRFWEIHRNIWAGGQAAIMAIVQPFWAGLKQIWAAAVESLGPPVAAAWELQKQIWAATCGAIVGLAKGFWAGLVSIYQIGHEALMKIIGPSLELSKRLWDTGLKQILPVIKAFWNSTKEQFRIGAAVLEKIWTGLLGGLTWFWTEISSEFEMGVNAACRWIGVLGDSLTWVIGLLQKALSLIGLASKKGVKVPGVGARAEGGAVSEGLTMVGERGPEAIIRRGSEVRVLSAANTPTAASGSGPNVTINMGNVTVRDSADIDRLSEELARATVRGLRTVGMVI
jgi:TP901 family phage tail tape measure protein